jgi:WD repeat-containing protein 53
MVHSLAWSPSGRLLAAGLGDGTTNIFLMANRSLVDVARLREGGDSTDAAVASVLFPAFLPCCTQQWQQHQHPTAQDRFMAVIRNDSIINLWDLGVTVAGEHAIDPFPSLSSAFLADGSHSTLTPTSQPQQQSNKKQLLQDSMQDMSIIMDQPKLLYKIPHKKKPNWMASSSRGRQQQQDKQVPSCIFVADTTNDITAYTLRLG